MKLILVNGLLCILLIFGLNQISHAAVYTLIPPDDDMYDLEHSKAYKWGISFDPLPYEIITEAELKFEDINNWRVEADSLFVSLLGEAEDGIEIFSDNQAGAVDYFGGEGKLLFTFTDDNEYWNGATWVNPVEDLVYKFTESDLGSFNQMAADGNFGLGFDPDCHYWNEGIEFKFHTTVIPEPASMLLFGIGMLGFGAFRRKRRF